MNNKKTSKPKFVPHDKIDKFVENQVAKGKDWFWDGWTLNIFKPVARARTHVKGVYRNGEWGMVSKVEPTTKGFWVIQNKHLEAAV